MPAATRDDVRAGDSRVGDRAGESEGPVDGVESQTRW